MNGKILIINTVAGIRSTGRICTDLADLAIKHNFECKVAYGREKIPTKYKSLAIRIGNGFDNFIDKFMSLLRSNSGFNSKRATKRFLKKVDDYDPDIIHLHNLHGFYLNVEMLFDYIKRKNKMVVWTLHDCWGFTGHCTYFQMVGCNKWTHGCGSCPQVRRYPYGLFDKSSDMFLKKERLFSGVRNLVIVTPSLWLSSLVEKSFLANYQIEMFHNGVDANSFYPDFCDVRETYNIQKDKKIVLGVSSSWDAGKGYYDFIKLSKMLPCDYQIVLVGLTAKQAKNLPFKMIGIRKTNSVDDLRRLYSIADVFVNPTYEDNYPTVNIEAQMCGTPCITYSTGGSIESVPPENVVETGNLDNLCQKILSICSKTKSTIFCPHDFDKAFAFQKYIDLYKKIMELKQE